MLIYKIETECMDKEKYIGKVTVKGQKNPITQVEAKTRVMASFLAGKKLNEIKLSRMGE